MDITVHPTPRRTDRLLPQRKIVDVTQAAGAEQDDPADLAHHDQQQGDKDRHLALERFVQPVQRSDGCRKAEDEEKGGPGDQQAKEDRAQGRIAKPEPQLVQQQMPAAFIVESCRGDEPDHGEANGGIGETPEDQADPPGDSQQEGQSKQITKGVETE